jgi:hypothetical protein
MMNYPTEKPAALYPGGNGVYCFAPSPKTAEYGEAALLDQKNSKE